jgi:hypothetical protein
MASPRGRAPKIAAGTKITRNDVRFDRILDDQIKAVLAELQTLRTRERDAGRTVPREYIVTFKTDAAQASLCRFNEVREMTGIEVNAFLRACEEELAYVHVGGKIATIELAEADADTRDYDEDAPRPARWREPEPRAFNE